MVNGAALKLAGITRDTPVPQGGAIEKDDSGEPNGILKENAIDLMSPFLPPDTPDVLQHAIEMVNQSALSYGLTTIHDITDKLPAYQAAHRDRRMKVRVLISPIVTSMADAEVYAKAGVHSGFGDEFLKLGAVKMYADGAPAAKTAAVYMGPEADRQNLGLLIWKTEEMHTAQHMLAAAGWQLETHAIGRPRYRPGS